MENKQESFWKFEKHLMEDSKPSNYFNEMLKSGLFSETYPFTLLGDLMDTPQSPKYHPEGSVWNHTMLVVDQAAEVRQRSQDPRVFMWAALLHDLGKARTTREKKGRITSYDHDKWGAKLAAEFLEVFSDDQDFIKKVVAMVRWHMQTLFVVRDLPFAEIKKMLDEVSLDEIALLSLCDRLGRGGMTPQKIAEERENIRCFVEKCQTCK